MNEMEQMLLEDAGEDTTPVARPGSNSLGHVGEAANKMVRLEKEIEDAEKALKDLKAEYQTLTEKTLPDLMLEVGLASVKTTDGKTIEVKNVVAGSITQQKAGPAFSWLRTNGHGDLIKTVVTVKFGRGDEAKAAELVEVLKKREWNVEKKENVHPQTLGAWAREMLEKGEEIPLETLGIFTGRVAKVKK